MRKTQTFSIFLASPGDVAPERAAAREVVEELNRTVARQHGVAFEIVGWETDTTPGYGEDPQVLVNRQIASMQDHDLFVGIMWNRFGQPTPRAGSGTEEEFDRAVASFEESGRPDIWFYFKEAPATIKDLEQSEQIHKVLLFKQRVQRVSLTQAFSETAEFRDKLREQLTRLLPKLGLQTPQASPESGPQATAGQVRQPPAYRAKPSQWALLADRFFRLKSVTEPQQGMAVLEIVPSSTEDDAAMREMRPGDLTRQDMVTFAYRDEGGIARVEAAEFTSSESDTLWRAVLRIQSDQQGGVMGEMSYNGISPDEIAEMRARLILLDEQPKLGRGKDMMLLSFIQGVRSEPKVKHGIFPELWQRLGGTKEDFLPLARLWAVFWLKATGTCEHILELELGPVSNNNLPVRFRGRRSRQYANTDPATIEVEGVCSLGRSPSRGAR